MNNITFGDDSVGYYETVAGGAGAVSYIIYNNICTHMHLRIHACIYVLGEYSSKH